MFLRPLDLFAEYGFPPSSFGAVKRLQEEMNQWFDGTSSGRANYPAVRFYGEGEQLTMEAWIAGLDSSSLEVTVEGNQLTLKGRTILPSATGGSWVRKEIPEGEFERSFQLPYRIADDQVKASYKNGVLLITMPRAAQDKPRKIEVSVQ